MEAVFMPFLTKKGCKPRMFITSYLLWSQDAVRTLL